MDEVGLLRQLLASATPEVDAPAEARARARLEGRIASARIPSIGDARRRRHRRVAALATAAAIVVVVVALVVVVLPTTTGPEAAADTLHGLAETARSRPAAPLPAGSYAYVRSEGSSLGSGQALEPAGSWAFRRTVTHELWEAADGSGRIVVRYGDPVFLSDADEAAWRAAGSPPLQPAGETIDFTPDERPHPDLGTLPTDPDRLAPLIEERRIVDAPAGELATFDVIGELLALPDAPPDLRAALFDVAAGLPDIEDAGTIEDPLGRSGRAVVAREGDRSDTLIFDPETSMLLAVVHERIVEGEPLTTWEAYGPPAVVDGLVRPSIG
jgi:hypothetical protein